MKQNKTKKANKRHTNLDIWFLFSVKNGDFLYKCLGNSQKNKSKILRGILVIFIGRFWQVLKCFMLAFFFFSFRIGLCPNVITH